MKLPPPTDSGSWIFLNCSLVNSRSMTRTFNQQHRHHHHLLGCSSTMRIQLNWQRMSAWPSASFQNRSYWQSGALFWIPKNTVSSRSQLILCQLSRWRGYMWSSSWALARLALKVNQFPNPLWKFVETKNTLCAFITCHKGMQLK
jgi:hypothetical protein